MIINCEYDDLMNCAMSGGPCTLGNRGLAHITGKVIYNHKFHHMSTLDGKFHGENDEPAVITFHGNGMIRTRRYCKHGEFHRNSGPAVIIYHENGNKKEEFWLPSICFSPSYSGNNEYSNYMSSAHNDSGPASILYYKSGKIQYEYYKTYGRFVEDKPGVIERCDNESNSIKLERWYQDDKPSRDGGPAVTRYAEDEPGKIDFAEYLKDGKRHNESGPAFAKFTDRSPHEEYWLKGRRYDKDEYYKKVGTNP